MKKTVVALALFCTAALPAFGQEYSLGEETKGMKVKISDDTEFALRVRLQPRFDTGDLIASKDGKSYESSSDMYLRRIRLEMDGKLVKNLKYNLTFEADKNGIRGKDSASKSNETKIQYAYFDYLFSDEGGIRFGKAKLPFSRVSLTSSSKQLIIERPSSTEKAKKLFDDYYQTNLLLHGDIAEGVMSYNFTMADGWENGNFLNGKDDVDGKVFKSDPLYVARLEVSPPGWTEKSKSDAHLGQGRHLTFAVSYAAQSGIEYSTLAGVASTDSEDRSLRGADISAHIGGLTAQAEYIAWKEKYNRTVPKAAKEPEGWYVQAGYLIPGMNIEPVARYEIYDQNTNAAAGSDDTEEKNTTLGLNWYLKGHSYKIGVNWVHSEFGKNAKSDVGVSGADTDKRDVYQIQAQVYF
jgi:phosphate-selective porin OprO/OprP